MKKEEKEIKDKNVTSLFLVSVNIIPWKNNFINSYIL